MWVILKQMPDIIEFVSVTNLLLFEHHFLFFFIFYKSVTVLADSFE